MWKITWKIKNKPTNGKWCKYVIYFDMVNVKYTVAQYIVYSGKSRILPEKIPLEKFPVHTVDYRKKKRKKKNHWK